MRVAFFCNQLDQGFRARKGEEVGWKISLNSTQLVKSGVIETSILFPAKFCYFRSGLDSFPP